MDRLVTSSNPSVFFRLENSKRPTDRGFFPITRNRLLVFWAKREIRVRSVSLSTDDVSVINRMQYKQRFRYAYDAVAISDDGVELLHILPAEQTPAVHTVKLDDELMFISCAPRGR